MTIVCGVCRKPFGEGERIIGSCCVHCAELLQNFRAFRKRCQGPMDEALKHFDLIERSEVCKAVQEIAKEIVKNRRIENVVNVNTEGGGI